MVKNFYAYIVVNSFDMVGKLHIWFQPVTYTFGPSHHPHHPYLVVELSSNLNPSFNVENVIGKANRSLGFIRCNHYSCPENVKGQAYITLVHPCLEYACSMWDPHTQKHCHDIEGVQWRSTRFVKKLLWERCYEREPGTVSNLLNDLNWPSLQLRRKIAQLTTMYKIVNNKFRVNILEHIARSYHSSKLINIGSSSNTYKYNFFY